jgi:hypothetical protein
MGYNATNGLDEHIANFYASNLLGLCNLKNVYVLPKYRLIFNRLQSVISQRTVIHNSKENQYYFSLIGL